MVKRIIHINHMTVTFLKSRHETQGVMDAFEVTIPAHVGSIVPHLHREYDETILGVDGITTWTLNGRQTQLCAGEQLVISRGITHNFINLHEQAARMICIHTPGMVGPEYYEELAFAMEAEGPTDYAALAVIMTRYGVIPVSV